VEIRLTGQTWEYFYYLRIPKGTRENPTVQTFTIVPDYYDSTLYYIELWDPVYGYHCGSISETGSSSETLDVRHNARVTVVECDVTPAKSEESPKITKYGSGSQTSQSQTSRPTVGSLRQSLTGRRILSGSFTYLARIE